MTRPFLPHVITDDSALGGKIIERSVRLRKDNDSYFNRTATVAGDRRTFTLSGWFKFYKTETTDVGQDFLFMCGDSPDNQLQLSREGNAQINFEPKTSGSTDARFYTSGKFRGHSWYHLVLKIDSTQSTASDRMAFYINGVQDNEDSALVTTTYPSQNLEFKWGENSISYVIGRRTHSGYVGNADIQVADLHYVSGYAYDATAFGYFEDQTGIWRPKKYTGSYGSAGWHLEFKDNSSTSALGKDTSGNGNDFTANGLSVSSGLDNDSSLDTPTNIFPTLNPTHAFLNGSSSYASEGNLQWNSISNNQAGCPASMAFPTTGKWYWEIKLLTNNANFSFGITPATYSNVINPSSPTGSIGYAAYGSKIVSGSETSSWAASFSNSDNIGAALDMENKSITFYKNNSAVGTINLVSGYENVKYLAWIKGDTASTTIRSAINFGAGGHVYSPPTGFKTLCSQNLIPESSPILDPQKHFDVFLYTPSGGGTHYGDLEFTPDMVWLKSRTQGYSPYFFDVVRGTGQKGLNSATNAQEGADTSALTSFDRGGFTLPVSGVNDTGSGTNGVVAWCWKAGGAAVSNNDGSITTSISANQKAGFSIVTWTGNGSNSTVGHGLGKAPKWIICKLRDTTTQDWFFNVGEITGDRGKYMKFNESGGIVSDIHTFPPTAASSTVFTVGGEDGGNSSNGNGSKYVAYCWAEIPGYSKIGSYTGNGSADGTFVYLGFRPAWIIVKKSTDDNWPIYDYKRDPHNVGDHRLFGDVNTVEGAVGQEHIDFLSNGVKWRRDKNPFNNSGSTYFYMAFAKQPGTTPFDTFPNTR